jgi:hypothetical protein
MDSTSAQPGAEMLTAVAAFIKDHRDRTQDHRARLQSAGHL